MMLTITEADDEASPHTAALRVLRREFKYYL